MAPPIDYRQIAAADARKYGVPISVFLRQINQESGFNPAAHSGAGADGIAQFIPSTARSYGVNTKDPVSSLDGAARLDADLIRRYGSVARALSAYNSGRPDAYKDPGFAGGQTFNYVRRILGGASTGGAGAATPSVPAPAAAGSTPAAAPNRQALVQALLAASESGDYGKFFGAVQAQRQSAMPASNVTPGGQTTPTPVAPVGRDLSPQTPDGPVVGGQGEDPRFLAALADLAGARHAPVNINSGLRSLADQQRLWNNRANNPNPVARPGTSLHERGLAADGTIGGIPLGTLPAALLARFGLATVPGDPVHVQWAGR